MPRPALVILASLLKVSKYPRAGMPEGRSLYLLKLVPRILTQTCCSSTSYILVSTYRNNVKRMVEWVTIPHYNFPLLQFQRVVRLRTQDLESENLISSSASATYLVGGPGPVT